MHPVAKRCLIWAVAVMVVGVVTLIYGPDVQYWFQDLVGFNADPALHVFGAVMAVARYFALPLAAGLVTATIVIQTLAPPPAPDADD